MTTTVITHTIMEEEVDDHNPYPNPNSPWYRVMKRRVIESGPHHDIITDTIQKVSSSSLPPTNKSSSTPYPYRSKSASESSASVNKQPSHPSSSSSALTSKPYTFAVDSSSDEDDSYNGIYMID